MTHRAAAPRIEAQQDETFQDAGIVDWPKVYRAESQGSPRTTTSAACAASNGVAAEARLPDAAIAEVDGILAPRMDVEPTLDEARLNEWVGNTQTREDRIDCRQANLLKATIDSSREDLQEGDMLPLGWHWIYFPEALRTDELGRDGHAVPGGFLPPVALPKRMWAGTRLHVHQPIRLGEQLQKVSEVVSINRKSGKSGDLCFVTVKHRLIDDKGLRLEENHDIVYRGETSGAGKADPPAAETDSDTSVVIEPSTTLLFRYSALTFNGHRIHYDIDFCKEVEGYPGLVVHAPLTATLMLNLAERHYAYSAAVFEEFRQRSVSPLFHNNPFTVHLRESESGCRIWVANHQDQLAAQADLSFA